MKSREIAQWRMNGQRLWGTPFDTPQEVVQWLGAVQAQEFHLAKWSVAQRTAGVGNADMDRAFAEGEILRTHLLRPTWHFVLPADIRWMVELTAPRVNALMAHYHRRLGLDDKLLVKSDRLVARALQGGNHLTRKEVAAVLDRAGIDTADGRLGFILMRAELDAVVCSGAPRGKQQTYASFDERAPQARSLDRDEALAELTRRYFTARGPATVKDFVRWSNLTVATGRSGVDMVKSQLEHEVVDGRTYWFAGSSPGPKPRSPTIDLVQGYDECIMSYSESRDVLGAWVGAAKVLPDRGVLVHAILLDGQLIGHWKPTRKTKSLATETSLYRPLRRNEARALEAAVERYARFMGVPVTVS